MKTLVIAIACLLCLGAGFYLGSKPKALQTAKAQEKTREKKPTSPKGPARVLPSTHDFGAMQEGTAKSITLTLERPDDGEIQLGRIYSPCPCITVSAPKRVFQAGEKAHVDVQLHSLTLHGKTEFKAYIQIIKPFEQILSATVKANVSRVPAKLMIKPNAVHLGAVDKKRSAEVDVYNLTKRPVQIHKIEVDGKGLTVRTPHATRIQPGKAAKLTIDLKPTEIPQGPLNVTLLIYTSLREHGLVRVPIDGSVIKK